MSKPPLLDGSGTKQTATLWYGIETEMPQKLRRKTPMQKRRLSVGCKPPFETPIRVVKNKPSSFEV
jgi:hypothetical protein